MTNYWDTTGSSEAVGSYRIHSGDTHVVEPGDLWTTRMDGKYRDRAPRIVREADADWWYSDGLKLTPVGQSGTRFTPEKYTGREEEVRPGGYLPEKFLEESDMDGVDINVLFPSPANACYRAPDSELLTAIFTTYNDWLAEFCSADPRRLRGIALLSDDVPRAVKELEQHVKLGFVGGMIPVMPLPDRPYSSPVYEPLWAAAQEMQVPLAMHVGTTRATAMNISAGMTSQGTSSGDAHFRDSISDMIFGGVFERYPNLQIGCMEMGIGWIPYFIRTIDRAYMVGGGKPRDKFKSGTVPSDFLHRNVFYGFQDDDLGIRLRDVIGVDNLMYANDYPHADCIWPRSRQVLEQMMAGCPEEEKAKMAGGNAVRIYRLD